MRFAQTEPETDRACPRRRQRPNLFAYEGFQMPGHQHLRADRAANRSARQMHRSSHPTNPRMGVPGGTAPFARPLRRARGVETLHPEMSRDGEDITVWFRAEVTIPYGRGDPLGLDHRFAQGINDLQRRKREIRATGLFQSRFSAPKPAAGVRIVRCVF